MDSNQNRITSAEQFRDELQAVLDRAQENLIRDDGLANIALLRGYPVLKQILFIGSQSEEITEHLRGETRHGSYESAMFITMAVVKRTGGEEVCQPLYRATSAVVDLGPLENATLCVMVEGAHRDFGNYASHWEFRREGEKQFVFGKRGCGTLVGGVLTNLWPKKRLDG